MRRTCILLAAMTLAATTGQILRSDEPQPDSVILLPPFLVEEQSAGGPDWTYGRAPGLEILSACETDETQEFVQEVREQRTELMRLIPDEFLLHTALPTTLILYPESMRDNMDHEMLAELKGMPKTSPLGYRLSPMNDLRLTDPDSSYIFILLNDLDWIAHNSNWSIYLPRSSARVESPTYSRPPSYIRSPSYVRFLISARAPALPDWYGAGATHLYESMIASDVDAREVSFRPLSGHPWQRGGFEPDPWISESAASALRREAEAARPLIPLCELFVAAVPAGKPEEYRRVWEAEAELFVRWALSGRVKDGRDALRRFAEEASAQPATEELFKSCFGMDYADALDSLSDYLPQAVREPLDLPSAETEAPRPMELRPATQEEIHRIKGEWARRALRVIKEDFPKAMPLYAEKTRRLLQHSYDRGERNPWLLASLALFRMGTGDAIGCRAILEENPAAGAARPIAGLELAQLHMLDALQKPAGPNGTLSEEQAASILVETWAALRLEPPIEGAYMLAARVAAHLGRDPTRLEREHLSEGALLFPRNSQLVIQSASWDLRAGDVAEARRLLDLGLWDASDPSARAKLALLNNLAKQASTPAN